MKYINKILVAAALCFATLAVGVSCKTDTGDPVKDRNGRVTNAVLAEVGSAVEKTAFNILANTASAKLQGQQVDMAHAMSTGLYSTMTSIDGAAALQHIANAWSGNQIPAIASTAATAFLRVSPTNPADKAAVVAAIATGISNAALSVATP